MENRAVQVQIKQLGRKNTELMVEMLKWKEEAQKVSQTCKSKAASLTRNSESQISNCRAELEELQRSLKQVKTEKKKLEDEAKDQKFTNLTVAFYVFCGYLLLFVFTSSTNRMTIVYAMTSRTYQRPLS